MNTPKHSEKRKSRIRPLAIVSTVVLAIGLVSTGALSASAHTGDLFVTASCNTTTGNYDLTAKLTTSQTNEVGSTNWKVGTASFTGTPSSAAGLDRGPVASKGAQTVLLGTFSVPGTTTGYGPWVYAFTKWTPDNFSKGSDGQLTTKLAGDCKIPVTILKDATAAVTTTPATCEAPGSATFTQTNATWNTVADTAPGDHTRTATAVANHQFADGSSTKTVSYNIENQLNPNAPPCVSNDASASVKITTAATCTVSGTATASVENAVLVGDLDETVGAHTATFTATGNHRFSDGSSTLKVDYTVPGADNSLCPTATLIPVTYNPPTCTTGSTYTVPDLTGTGAKFTDGTIPGNDPKYIRQAAGTYPLAAGQTVWFQEHAQAYGYQPAVAVYTFTGAAADNNLCPSVDLLPVTQTPPTCTEGSTYTVPVLPDTLKYSLNADGTRPEAGTYPLAAGQTVTITEHTLASAPVKQASATYTFTGADADTTLCPKDAVADVAVSTPTCTASGIAIDTETYATLDAALEESVGTHTATFTAVAGHHFSDGTDHASVQYTVNDVNLLLCPGDAVASVTVDKQATCTTDSANTFTATNATLEGLALDTTVGTHDAIFTANEGHVFANGKTTEDIAYTVTAHKTGADCTITTTHTHGKPPVSHIIAGKAPVAPAKASVLAFTGSEDVAAGLIAAALLLGLGITLMIIRRRRA